MGDGLSMEAAWPVEVRAWGVLGRLGKCEWQRVLRSETGRTTVGDAASLRRYSLGLRAALSAGATPVLPVVAYSGTGRLWHLGRLSARVRRAGSPLSATRTLGYVECLAPSSSFREFGLWFRQLELGRIQARQHSGHAERAAELDRLYRHVVRAVDQVLEPSGWRGLFYDLATEEISADHPEHGVLPVSRLSDGVRTLLGLVADLAFRCAKLNPHLGPEGTPGLVLIDEVGMHLHPGWQKRVVGALRAAFPRVQFVLTTHSPHVVSTVPWECVRVLTPERGIVPAAPTEGAEADRVLARVFAVDPEPDVEVVRKLRRYVDLVDDGKADGEEARALHEELEARLGRDDPRLLRADLVARLRRRR